MDDTRALAGFLTWKEHNEGCAKSTVNKYLLTLERLRKYLHREKTTLLQASTEQLRTFAGLHAHTTGVAPRSRRPMVAAIRGFYAWAHREGVLSVDPAVVLEYPKVGRKLPQGLQREHVEALLMAPDLNTFLGVRDAAIMMLLAGTGLRVSGLVSLNESDLIFQMDEGRERLVVRVKEKGGRERLVPAPDEALLMLHAYLGHEDLAAIDRTLPNGDVVVFVSTRRRNVSVADYYGEARRLTDRAVCRMVATYGEALKLPAELCHPHAFRHLYGTELAESDVDVLKIQALMGHADPKTSEIYVHTAMRKLARIVDQANPLSKLNTPTTDLARRLRNGR